MTAKTELERLVAVETKIDILISSNEKLIRTLEDMQKQQLSFVQEVQYKADLLALEAKIEKTKQRSAIQTWLTGTLAAGFGAVMAILIQAYFK